MFYLHFVSTVFWMCLYMIYPNEPFDSAKTSHFMFIFSSLPLSLSVSNPCAKMNCAFLCLLNPSGARCVCPEGKILLNRTCTDTNISGTSVKTRLAGCSNITNRAPAQPREAPACQTQIFHLSDFDWSVLFLALCPHMQYTWSQCSKTRQRLCC